MKKGLNRNKNFFGFLLQILKGCYTTLWKYESKMFKDDNEKQQWKQSPKKKQKRNKNRLSEPAAYDMQEIKKKE